MNEPHASRAADEAAAAFEALRPRLVGVAYGLLGTLAEAEDAVQEAWIRLQRSDLDAIVDLAGWLVTTTSRIALDILRSARVRRESYVGPWLPEPVETAPDPADSVALADSMSWAMLVVLETLSPAERAAFVLHDVFGVGFGEIAEALGREPAACRKLASRARAHVEARKPRFDVDPEAHREVVDAFAEAAGSGDYEALLRVLDPEAVLISDGGGVVRAALEPIRTGEKVARFLVGVMARTPGTSMRATVVSGNPGLLVFKAGRFEGVIALGIAGGRVRAVDYVRNPNKFHGLRSLGAVGQRGRRANDTTERRGRPAAGPKGDDSGSPTEVL
ncbi:MAG TPA: RNA polymerase sigma factor SigJ [Glycomyces sp.]|nr:RNA polymerase sigma factor SigJ [Glycomyces sp.]